MMEEREKCGPICGLNILWAVLFAVGIGIWLIGMPSYLDDWCYMEPLRGWNDARGIDDPTDGGYSPGDGVPWGEIVASWGMHYNETNTRLGNMMAPLLLMFPKWVGSSLALLMILFSFWAVLRLAAIDWCRSLLVPVALALWMFMLPWRDHLGSLAFQLNYLLPTGLAMGVAVCVWRGDGGALSCIFTFLLSFLAGMAHEGIAGPAFCGLTALIVLYKDFRRRRVYSALGGMMCGLLVLASSPGLWGRVTMSEGQERFTPAWLAAVGLICLPYVVAAALWLVMAMRGKSRRALLDDRFLTFMMVGGLVSCLLVCMSDTTPRAGWWACFAAVASLLTMLRISADAEWRRPGAVSVTVSAACLIAVFAHLVSVDVETLRLRRTFDSGLREWLDDGRGAPAVFGKIPLPAERPLAALMLPDDMFFSRGLRPVGRYYGYDARGRREGRVEFAIVPEELRRVTRCEQSDLPVCRRGPWLYAQAGTVPEPDADGYMTMLVDYGAGFAPRQVIANPFVSEADGLRYYWLVPVEGWYVSRFKTIKAVKVPE